MIRICFVCLGNICRSPTAEAVMRTVVAREGLDHAIDIDSAGTGNWHVGERADPRSRAAAQRRGIEITGRARQFVARDFERFDHVVAMDRSNHKNLLAMATREEHRLRVRLLREFEPVSGHDLDVPDPYYGGSDGFDEVLDICEAACLGLLTDLRTRHGL